MKKAVPLKTASLLGIIMLSCTVLPAAAGAFQDTGMHGMVQRYLQQKGIGAQVIALDRQDGFTRGIRIESVSSEPVVIGLTATPFDDRLLLVLYRDAESIMQVQEDGSVELIAGQQIDIKYILCMLDAVLALVDDAKTCPTDNAICYARALLSFVLFVINCSESTTTTSVPG
jgi:hypothetical protein